MLSCLLDNQREKKKFMTTEMLTFPNIKIHEFSNESLNKTLCVTPSVILNTSSLSFTFYILFDPTVCIKVVHINLDLHKKTISSR